MSTLEDLKKEATDLGITFAKTIGEAKLKEKIEAHYKSQETSEKEIEEAIAKKEAEEKSEAKAVSTDKETFNQLALKLEAKARETSVVTIIDNDQRQNNHTTSCTVNCSNMHFDLGTVILPLNLPVEVKQGHLNVLKEIRIPQHVQNPTTGLSEVRMRPRYTISYERV